jgi:predicted dehydrogenase
MAAAGVAQVAKGAAPIGIGVLGMVHSHAGAVLKVIRANPDWKLIGVCESNTEVQKQMTDQGITLMSREQLLRHPDIRVIAVESDVPDHAADGLAVVEAGKHIHLEKAPADTIADFERIVDIARRKNLTLQLGYMWRYHPGITKAVEAAREGWLGSIYQVRASINNFLEARQRPQWARFKGGVMFELGGHVIDPIARLMGRPTKITPVLGRSGTVNDAFHDNTVALLEWKNAIGVVQASTVQPYSGQHRAIEIYGTNGTAIVNPIEPPALTIELQSAAGPYQKGKQTIPMPAYTRHEADFADLAAVVRGERKLPVSFDQDLLVQEVLLRCSGMA